MDSTCSEIQESCTAVSSSPKNVLDAIQAIITQSYLDPDYSNDYWDLVHVVTIKNDYLEKMYSEKRQEMQKNGDVPEAFLFTCYKGSGNLKAIMQRGLEVRSTKFSFIGDRAKGVVLCKNADVQLRAAQTHVGEYCWLFVFLVSCGKIAYVTPSQDGLSNASPTEGADCHCCATSPQTDRIRDIAISSQVYIYDRSDGDYSSRPRQCLPFAYVMYQKKVPGVIPKQVVFHFSCSGRPNKCNSAEVIDLTESDDDESDAPIEASSLTNAAMDVGESSDSKDTSPFVKHFLMLAERGRARRPSNEQQQQRTSSNNNSPCSNFSPASNQPVSSSSSPRLLLCPALPVPPRLSLSSSMSTAPRLSPSPVQDVQPAAPRFSSSPPVFTMPRLSPSPSAQISRVVSMPRAQAHQSVPRLQSSPVGCVSASVLLSSLACSSQTPENNAQTLQQSVTSFPSIHGQLNSTGTNRLYPMQNQSSGAGVLRYRITPRPLGTSVPPRGGVPNVGRTSFQGSPIEVRQQLQTVTLRSHHSNLSANYWSPVSCVMQNVAETGCTTLQRSNLLLQPSYVAVSEQPAVASAQLLRHTTACAVNRGGEGLRAVAPPVTASAAFWLLPQQQAAVPSQICTGGTFSQVPSQRLLTAPYQWPRQNIPTGTPTNAYNVAASQLPASQLPSTNLVNFGASREAVFLPSPLTASAAAPYYVMNNASAVNIGYAVSPQSGAVVGALPVDGGSQSTSNVFVGNGPELASDLASDRSEDASSATVGTPSGARLQTNVKPEQPRSGRRRHGEMIVIDPEEPPAATAGENDLSWMEKDDTLSRLLAHLTPRCSDVRQSEQRPDADGDASALAENDDERTNLEQSNSESPADGQNEIRQQATDDDGADVSFDTSVPQHQIVDVVQQSQETVSPFDEEYSLAQLLDDIISRESNNSLLEPVQTAHTDLSGPSENDIVNSQTTTADQTPHDSVVSVTDSAVNQSDSSVLNQSCPAIVDVGRQLDSPLVCTSAAGQMGDLEANAESRTESVLLTEIEHIDQNESLETDTAHHQMPAVSSPSTFCSSAATGATVAVSSSVSVPMSSCAAAASDVLLLPVTSNAAGNTATETVSSCSVWPVQSLRSTATVVGVQNPSTFVGAAVVETSSGTDRSTTPFVVLSVPDTPSNKSSKRHNVGCSSTTAPSPATVTSIATQLVSGLRSSNVIRQRAVIANNLVGTQRKVTDGDSSYGSSKAISDGLHAKSVATATTPTQQQNTSSALSGSSVNTHLAPTSSSLNRKSSHEQLNFGKTTENAVKRRGENMLDEPLAKILRQQKPRGRDAVDVSCSTPGRSTIMCETVIYRLEPDGTVLTKVEKQPAVFRHGHQKAVKLQAVLELDCGVPEAWYESRLLETLTKKFGILKVVNAAKKSSRLYELNADQVVLIEFPSETCVNEQISATDADRFPANKRRRRFNLMRSDQRLASEDVTADSRIDFMNLSDRESSDSQRTNSHDESADTNLVIEDTHSISEECFSNFVDVSEASIGSRRNSQVVEQTAVAAEAAGNSNSNQLPENAGFGGISNVSAQTSLVERDPSAHRSIMTVARYSDINTAEDRTLPETQEHLSTQVMGNCTALPSTVNSASIQEPSSPPPSMHQSDHTKDAAEIVDSDAAAPMSLPPTSRQTRCRAVDCSPAILLSDAVSEMDMHTSESNVPTGIGASRTFASDEGRQPKSFSPDANQGAVNNKQMRSSNPYVEKGALLLPREISFQRRSVLFGRETRKETSMDETRTESESLDVSNLVENNSAITLTSALTGTETERSSAISEVGEDVPVSRSDPEFAFEECSSLNLHCSDLDGSFRSDIPENSSVRCRSNSDDVLASQAATSESSTTVELENDRNVASGFESDSDASLSRKFASSSGTEAGGMEVQASNRSCDTGNVTFSAGGLETATDVESGCTKSVHSELQQSVPSSSADVECHVTDETAVMLSAEFERETTTSEESSSLTDTVTTRSDIVFVDKSNLEERRESSERSARVIEQATVGNICDGAAVCEMETVEPMMSDSVDLVSVPKAMPISTDACEKSSQLDSAVSDSCYLSAEDSPSAASAGNQPDSDVEPDELLQQQVHDVNETALLVTSCGSGVLGESSSSLALDIQPISPDWMLCTEPDYQTDQTNAEINRSVSGMINKMPKRLTLADYKNRKTQNDVSVSAMGHSTSASLRGVSSSTVAQRVGRCLSGPAGVSLSKSTSSASVTTDCYGQRIRTGSTDNYILDCTECESIAHEGTACNHGALHISSAQSDVSRNEQAEITICTTNKPADSVSGSVADAMSTTMCASESTFSGAYVVGVGQLSRGNDQNIDNAIASGVKLVPTDHSCINSQSKSLRYATQVAGSAANECAPAACSSPQFEGDGASKKKQKRTKNNQFEDCSPWNRVLNECEPPLLAKRSNYGEMSFSETSGERYLLDPRLLDEESRRRYHVFIAETVSKVPSLLTIPYAIDRGLIKRVTLTHGEKNVTDIDETSGDNDPRSDNMEPTVRNVAMAKVTNVNENKITDQAEDGSGENTPPVPPLFDERQTKILEELVSHPNPEFIRRNVVLRTRTQSHESYSSTKTTTSTTNPAGQLEGTLTGCIGDVDDADLEPMVTIAEQHYTFDDGDTIFETIASESEEPASDIRDELSIDKFDTVSSPAFTDYCAEDDSTMTRHKIVSLKPVAGVTEDVAKEQRLKRFGQRPPVNTQRSVSVLSASDRGIMSAIDNAGFELKSSTLSDRCVVGSSFSETYFVEGSSSSTEMYYGSSCINETVQETSNSATAAAVDENNELRNSRRVLTSEYSAIETTDGQRCSNTEPVSAERYEQLQCKRNDSGRDDVVETPQNSNRKHGRKLVANAWQRTLETWPEISKNFDHCSNKSPTEVTFYSHYPITSIMKKFVDLSEVDRQLLDEECRESLESVRCRAVEESVYTDFIEELGWPVIQKMAKCLPTLAKELVLLDRVNEITDKLSQMSETVYNQSDSQAEIRCYEHADLTVKHDVVYSLLLLASHVHYDELRQMSKYHRSKLVYTVPDNLRLEAEINRFTSVENCNVFIRNRSIGIDDCMELFCLKLEIEAVQARVLKAAAICSGQSVIERLLCRLGWLHHHRRNKLLKITCNSNESLSSFRYIVSLRIDWYRTMSAYIEKSNLSNKPDLISFIDIQLVILLEYLSVIPTLHLTAAGNWIMTENNGQSC